MPGSKAAGLATAFKLIEAAQEGQGPATGTRPGRQRDHHVGAYLVPPLTLTANGLALACGENQAVSAA
ncbi:hypothetical protein [Actinoplanes sp. NPDC049802]|uniref:hypothetical protein n=1 Tax=Actinoplanes sp. NPDC049802 TaxID=3154742 RepID=UPI003405F7E1